MFDVLNNENQVLRDLTLQGSARYPSDYSEMAQFLSENNTLTRFWFAVDSCTPWKESHVELLARNTTLKVLAVKDDPKIWKNILKQCGSLQEIGWCWFDLDADFQAFNLQKLKLQIKSSEHMNLLNDLLRTTQLKVLRVNVNNESLGDDFVNAIAQNRSCLLYTSPSPRDRG